MIYPHVIRLRGPWNYEPLGRAATEGGPPRPLPPGGRTTLPAEWDETLRRDFRGRVAYRRRFNRPSGLDPHERVWLVVEGADPRATVALNGRKLGDVHGYALTAEFDVSGSIDPANELVIEVELPGVERERLRPGREHKPGGLFGEVRLEVRSTTFISHLAVCCCYDQGAPWLHVAGRVAGEPTGPSPAVVVSGRERELLYGEVTAAQPFELKGQFDDLPCWPPAGADREPLLPLEIKLLDGAAAAWSTIRRTACARVEWDAATARLAVGGQSVAWPLRVVDPPPRNADAAEVAQWLESLGLPPSSVVALREILPDTWYERFDAACQGLVQYVPPSWADAVCPRLAHHPSIVAWAAPAAEFVQGPPFAAAYGRPWLDWEACTVK